MSEKKLLIIGYVWPEPKGSAAGGRMMQLIETFQNDGYDITFSTPSVKSENAFDLKKHGIHEVPIQLNDSNFDDFVKDLSPTVVLFDRFMMEEQFGWRVAENCPNALRILDTEDLHGLRKGREEALKNEAPFSKNYLFNDTSKREIAGIYRCDISLIISEEEMDILKNQFNFSDQLLYYLPFLMEGISEEKKQDLPKFKDRQHYVTVGNFLHKPNVDAIIFLKEKIWPTIHKKNLKAEMHIYGAYATEKAKSLNDSKTNFLVKGFAENVDETMRNARLCLAPLRYGAGLKGKLIDAMKNGTPCIMTSIAAEGIFGIFEPNGYVEDDPDKFANRAIELYSDKILWRGSQKNGFNTINGRFDKRLFVSDFHDKIEVTLRNLSTHRNQNFIGQMLQLQTLQASKYMGKWIEEKNKDKQ